MIGLLFLVFSVFYGCYQLIPKLEMILSFVVMLGCKRRLIEGSKTHWKRCSPVGIFGVGRWLAVLIS